MEDNKWKEEWNPPLGEQTLNEPYEPTPELYFGSQLLLFMGKAMYNLLTTPLFWACLIVIFIFYELFKDFTLPSKHYQANEGNHSMTRNVGKHGSPIIVNMPRNSYVFFQDTPNGIMGFQTRDITMIPFQKPDQISQGTSCFLDKQENPRSIQQRSYNLTNDDIEIFQSPESLVTLHPPPVGRPSPVKQYQRLADVLPPSPYGGFDFKSNPKPQTNNTPTNHQEWYPTSPSNVDSLNSIPEIKKRDHNPDHGTSGSGFDPKSLNSRPKLRNAFKPSSNQNPLFLSKPQQDREGFSVQETKDQGSGNNSMSPFQQHRPGFSFERNISKETAKNLNFGNIPPSPSTAFVRQRSNFYGIDQ